MNRRGFTLLEMMVATMIMGIAVVGLLSGIMGSVRAASRVTDADRVLMVARARMDELLVDRSLPRNATVEGPLDPSLLRSTQAGWRAREVPFEVPPGLWPGAQVMDRLELEIWWMVGGQRRTFSLASYKTYVLLPRDVAPTGGQ